MRFSELLAAAQLEGPSGRVWRRGDADVRRVVADSRQAREGDCFVAVRGTVTDGHRYIPSAVAAGCTAVVCEDTAAVPPQLPCAVVADTRAAAGPLAQAVLGWPCRKLTLVGVTGTNGKTTFTYLLRGILSHLGHKTGLLGTIRYETIAESIPARTTTPDAIALAEMMARMVEAGGTHLVMEISSHALDQRRTEGIDFEVAVFTNLSGDHLDYHGTMAEYLSAKQRLFESLSPRARAVLNRDESHSGQMASVTAAPVLWYGLSRAADVQARIRSLDAAGSEFSLLYAGDEADVSLRLIGRHNVVNSLAAAAAALALGADLPAIARALGEVRCVPGRLQRVDADAAFDVLVDYAHTDAALENVLSAVRPVAGGRLILVFGCGGDRDRGKRPRMARVAERWADEIIVTSDNPRSEDPLAIIEEIAAGFTVEGRGKVSFEPDRRSAIAASFDRARPGDAVLIAGKGHEDYQVIGERRVHFDDVETAAELLRGRAI